MLCLFRRNYYFKSPGDGMLDASDMRSGLQLLANGACLEVASAPALRPAGGTPAMFDDQPEVPRAQSRRQSLQGDLLSSYEVNQVDSFWCQTGESLFS